MDTLLRLYPESHSDNVDNTKVGGYIILNISFTALFIATFSIKNCNNDDIMTVHSFFMLCILRIIIK